MTVRRDTGLYAENPIMLRSLTCHQETTTVLWALLCWLSAASSPLPAEDVAVASGPRLTVIQAGNRPVLSYQHEANPSKIYVAQWYTPGGVQVLRDSPHDHVHHRALMYAVGIDGVDFWAEVPPETYGSQRSLALRVATTAASPGLTSATIEQTVCWQAPGGTELAREQRILVAHPDRLPKASLLTWKCTLAPAEGQKSIELWGRHYFGLGMRFVPEMDTGSQFVLPQGATGTAVRGSERLTRAPWCALHGSVAGKAVTVAMFDAPANTRHPATWFTMHTPFAYLAATLNLHEQTLLVTADKPLQLRYGLALWDGTVPEPQIAAAYQTWLNLP
jgi:hypothetical protein